MTEPQKNLITKRIVHVYCVMWGLATLWVGCASLGEGPSPRQNPARAAEAAEAQAALQAIWAADSELSQASQALAIPEPKRDAAAVHLDPHATDTFTAVSLAAAAQPPAPPRPEGKQRLRFAVLSDMNGRYGSTLYGPAVHNAVARLITLRPDLVLSAGDMIAGQKQGLNYDAMWKSFHSAVTQPLTRAQIPFAVAPGNHDASGYPEYAAERRTYNQTWRKHRPDQVTDAFQMVDDTRYPLQYAFRQGPALFIALDATTKGPLKPEQRAWIDQVLTAHGDAPVRIVFGHVPLYPIAKGHADNEYLGDRALEQILIKHRVDLVISGHHHAYYPGTRHSLRLAAVSCVGSGPRALLGAPEDSAKRSFLWVELDEHGLLSVEALEGPDYTQAIDRQTLPEVVGLWPMWITRDDLTPAQATEAILRAEESVTPRPIPNEDVALAP